MVEIICSDKNIKKKALKKPDNKGITAYFIKYCCVITAAGCASDPVYLVADANMSEDVIDVHVVKGLGCSTSITSKAYLVFCKTRCGNDIFFDWFNKSIIVESTRNIREENDWNKEEYPAYVTSDGEALQINCYKSDEYKNIFISFQ